MKGALPVQLFAAMSRRAEEGIFAHVPRNELVVSFYRPVGEKNHRDDDKETTRNINSHLSKYDVPGKRRTTVTDVTVNGPNVSINEAAQCFVRNLLSPSGSSSVGPQQFIAMTKKMRQQIMSRLLSRLHRQLVVYNVKALFRIYMIYHRDDRLIHAICDVFNKRHVYDATELRQEIVQKNSKELTPKVMRNKVCQNVMAANPNILRLFDTRTLNYCRTFLADTANFAHDLSNSLPIIMCLNERDIDVMFERCRSAHIRREDFPVDLLPNCVRRPIARLIGMRRNVA